MSPNRLRTLLLALLVLAAIVSVVGKKADSAIIGWASFAIFLGAVGVYFRWRQAVRARVLDRESKTAAEGSDAPRAGPDQ